MEFPERFVFVCEGNLNRSPTAERVARECLVERGYRVGTLEDKTGFDFYVGSAGLMVDDWKDELDSFGVKTTQYENEMGDSVDRVYVADEKAAKMLCGDYDILFSKIEILGVRDDYKIHENPLDLRLLELVLKKKLEERMPKGKE